MMTMARYALATLLFLAASLTTAVGQVPNFPQTLPANTVVGRLGIGPGPSQAVPISRLFGVALGPITTAAPLGITGTDVPGSAETVPGIVLDRVYSNVGDSMDIVWGSHGTGVDASPRAGAVKLFALSPGLIAMDIGLQSPSHVDGYGNGVMRLTGDGQMALGTGGTIQTGATLSLGGPIYLSTTQPTLSTTDPGFASSNKGSTFESTWTTTSGVGLAAQATIPAGAVAAGVGSVQAFRANISSVEANVEANAIFAYAYLTGTANGGTAFNASMRGSITDPGRFGNVGLMVLSPEADYSPSFGLKISHGLDMANALPGHGVYDGVWAQDVINASFLGEQFGRPAIFEGRRLNGTNTAPTVLVAGNPITSLQAVGWTPAGWSASSRGGLDVYALETWTNSTNGTYVTVRATPSGTVVPQNVAVFSATSQAVFGVGIAVPQAPGHFRGSPAVTGDSLYQVIIEDSHAYNATPGAGLAFIGQYNSAFATTAFASIKGTKVNATDGDFKGRLEFVVNTGVAQTRAGYFDYDETFVTAVPIPSGSGGTGNGFAKFSGPTTSEKTFTLPNASATILTSNAAVTAAQGGTGQASYAVGDLLYASGATALSKLADVATGNVLISGGVTTAPSWGKVALTTHVSGILPLANGGTNADLSATGGTSQFLKQASAGAAITVARPACSDLSDGGNGGCAATVTAPTSSSSANLSSCGGSPTLSSVSEIRLNSQRISTGVITTGSGATTCILTFAAAFSVAPTCIATPQAAGAGSPGPGASASAVQFATVGAGANYNYACFGTP